MKYHIVFGTGIFRTSTRYFGFVWERSQSRTSGDDGTFYGFLIYFWDMSLIFGLCIH